VLISLSENICCLRCFLNILTDGAVRIVLGSLFQYLGPVHTTEFARQHFLALWINKSCL